MAKISLVPADGRWEREKCWGGSVTVQCVKVELVNNNNKWEVQGRPFPTPLQFSLRAPCVAKGPPAVPLMSCGDFVRSDFHIKENENVFCEDTHSKARERI
jgi:hypothetical protein